MPPSDFVLFRNIALTDAHTAGQTSNVGEPSLANNGREIFLTGNWYASRSLDKGTSWSHVPPANQLPPASGGFCSVRATPWSGGRGISTTASGVCCAASVSDRRDSCASGGVT